ncbi:hypothetical protein AVEN_75770-1 [Araneus ventricosus]|uniref:Uncharacterized protein n=1 Tax=Araneus ventricosus TaxID=182803 RepID=A0A4Y2S6L0_ARAVE|nr:hypothetical protein AVEN_102370-1 [Araneus ventricosus]GBN82857.1 hypothetical protein AVEN_196254-1 [Araneus ventricosus]GBN82860.1 hypothetical protein AVEN_268092-1 [Araneus ventricosus]GBN82870.1 hypothetical protein AVEN_75770-1 [Araneus ventricosus]
MLRRESSVRDPSGVSGIPVEESVDCVKAVRCIKREGPTPDDPDQGLSLNSHVSHSCVIHEQVNASTQPTLSSGMHPKSCVCCSSEVFRVDEFI